MLLIVSNSLVKIVKRFELIIQIYFEDRSLEMKCLDRFRDYYINCSVEVISQSLNETLVLDYGDGAYSENFIRN